MSSRVTKSSPFVGFQEMGTVFSVKTQREIAHKHLSQSTKFQPCTHRALSQFYTGLMS
jgi:hypothetical protein